MAMAFGVQAQINDGSFEGSGWNEASFLFGTPLCTVAECGNCGGPCVPRTGQRYAWFGGSGSPDEVASVDQDATIPNGSSANVVMYVKIPHGGDGTAANTFIVYVDGNNVGTLTALDTAQYVDYTLWSVNVSAYADGGVHNIKLEGSENGGNTFNVVVDDVALEVDGTIVGLFENENLPGVQVYPNPANSQITLAFNAMQGAAQVSIIDASGKVVNQTSFNEVSMRQFTFDSSNLANGLYTVLVDQAGNRISQRVLVQH